MTSYQATYDAVRDRIINANLGDVVSEVARQSFDCSFVIQRATDAIEEIRGDMIRPSVLYQPVLTKDGDKWIALYGPDLEVGVAGVGDTPEKAMIAFDVAWFKS